MKAGTYHFVLDCIIIVSVDAQFDLMHRRGTDTTVLVSWTQHFEPLPDSFDAQPYEVDKAAPAIDFAAGDKLVFRYTGSNTETTVAPSGNSRVRTPSVTK